MQTQGRQAVREFAEFLRIQNPGGGNLRCYFESGQVSGYSGQGSEGNKFGGPSLNSFTSGPYRRLLCSDQLS